MKKLTSTFCFLVMAFALMAVNAPEPTHYVKEDIEIKVDGQTLTLRAGTPVVVEGMQAYDSKNLNAGQSVNVRVKFNVVVNKQALVPAGALGLAVINDVRKPGIFGKPGRLELQIQSVQAVDGQQVLLSGIPLVVEGRNKRGLAWGVSVGAGLFTFGLGLGIGFFIKGESAEFRPGTLINSSVASDMEIESEK